MTFGSDERDILVVSGSQDIHQRVSHAQIHQLLLLRATRATRVVRGILGVTLCALFAVV